MIVEFIGSSGAGKTTLANGVRARITPSRRILPAGDLYLDRRGRRWITHPTAMNLVADVAALRPFLRARADYSGYLDFAFGILRRHAPSRIAKYNYMRNIVRAVGIHELARTEGDDAIVLVDEGTVLTAYLLFVYSRGRFDDADLARFARLVPLPDRIVYVRAPADALVRRAVSRRDRRRELAAASVDELREWLTRATRVFDALAAMPPLRDRVLVVDNPDTPEDADEHVVSRIETYVGASRRTAAAPREAS